MSQPKFDALDKALQRQAVINEALAREDKWDTKTKRQVKTQVEALRVEMKKELRGMRTEGPDIFEGMEKVIDMADKKLKGEAVEYPEYLNPETDNNKAA